jgi:hypothetical protein
METISSQKLKYVNFSIMCLLVNLSGIGVTDASGKISGSVFSRNRGGKYVRVKVKPVNPRSLAQSHARNRLTTLSQQFRSLTQAQIAAWNGAVDNFPKQNRLGNRTILSGIDLFISLNSNLLNTGNAVILTPPLPQAVIGFNTFSLVETALLFTLSFSPTPSDASTDTLIYATNGLSPGNNSVKSQYRLIGVMPAASATAFSILAMYTAKFGAPVSGTKIFVSLRPVNNISGQQGVGLDASVIAA